MDIVRADVLLRSFGKGVKSVDVKVLSAADLGSIDEVVGDADEVTVIADGMTLRVEAACGVSGITVYDCTGRIMAVSSEAEVTVGRAGVYIVEIRLESGDSVIRKAVLR